MTRIPLQYWRDGDLHWARFVSDVEPPVHEHWPGLIDIDAVDAIDAQHWHRFAINGNNREEVAVYLRLAWEVLDNHEIVGNANFYTEDAAKELGQLGTIANWQFQTDCEGPPGHLVLKGFTPARSSVQILPPPSDQQRAMRNKTLLFRIARFDELGALLRSVLSDASGEISLVGTSEAGAYRVTESLQSETQPNLATLLGDDDVFVSIGIGVDLGYNDHVAIAARRDMRPMLEPIVNRIDAAIVEYEKDINEFVSPDRALALMSRLAGQPLSNR